MLYLHPTRSHSSARVVHVYVTVLVFTVRTLYILYSYHVSRQPRIRSIEQTMNQRADKIKVVKGRMNVVEDEVFVDFCREIGIANIRSAASRTACASPLIPNLASFHWQNMYNV